MTRHNVERRLRRLALPAPSAALHERVLNAAAAVPRPRGPAGLAERLWFSRRWRLAWVAAVAVLLLSEAAVIRRVERRFEAPKPATTDPIGDLARELGVEPGWRATVTPARDHRATAEIWIEAR